MSFHRTKWRQEWPTFILIALITIVRSEEPDTTQPLCTHGGCYPATGNLLIGRDNNLSATSTCGMTSSQEYCIVSHLSEYEKCFLCDSRDPQQRGNHRIQNVIYLAGPAEEKTWWQSENGLESVSVRLDLEAEFHFTHLILKFKTFRPAAMLIERSADFGRTWKVYRYFSYNCTKMFPGVPVHALQKIDDVICDQRYSDIEPSTEGEVIFKVLDPAIKVEDPYSVEIQELLQITNLRINFTKLHTLGDNLLDQRPEVLHKYYYAVYELVVRGSCFCYGHASECSPVEGIEGGVEGMIHGRCVCKHRTTGLNCELCQDFFHDLPWRPAEADDPHSCKRCNCNHHATICHFDPAVFLATGGQSGGVCDDCQHNTMGRNCELCRPFYYKDPWSDIRAETACVPCDCDPVGSLDGGICDGVTDVDLGMISGQCRCKENVRGERCDSCRDNFYGLSRNDPLGCQPCQCDPRGIVAGNSPCDQISGDCYCKRFVTGRYCNQCLPEFWGLSNDVMGCRPCDCDFGGAYNNRCSLEDGQCDCRADITGRYCGAVIPGYFCMPLDYYTYEAETARGLSATDPQTPGDIRPESLTDCLEYYNAIQNGKKVRLRRHRGSAHITFRPAHILRATNRRARQLHQKADIEIIHREHSPDHMITWTGPGFARVRDGAGLLFHIDNIPIPMDYDIMIRYEPESAEDWEVIVSVTSHILPMSPRCGNTLPSEQMYRNKLPHSERYLLLPKPFCFENNNQYEISIRFQRLETTNRHPGSFILIDSLVLLPKVYELPGFHGNDPASTHRRQEMETYRCLESFKMATMPALAETCVTMLCSISAIIHDGALPCLCDLQGSLSAVCDKIGGQCMCKANVIGRRCDQCAPGTFGFGPTGCSRCDCDPQASISRFCNPVTGQCQCQGSVAGRRCSQCPAGQYGFPHCKPCQCNGHSEECDPRSGACANCRDFTSGRHCDKCLDGYYGDPVLGSGQQCRPCPCPGYPDTHNYHGSSCYADRDSAHILCLCAPGYAGSRCDLCSPGYYGNADQDGGECRPCQCNNNIDPSDPESCDARSGMCLNCLHNTDGHHCAECKAGYYGNAILRNCRRCSCNELGTMPSHCTRDTCYCDRVSGHCACRANVIGRNCDQCAANYWNFGADLGCEPCACQPEHSLRQDCNVYTGQCHCRAGFGGRICSQCQEDYWGDPKTRCEACSCDPVGSEMRSCDHGSGLCRCREGFSGRRCDQCDRGFRDNYPLCSACHQCFNQWDASITRLQDQLRVIHSKISDLQHGVQAPETSNLRDLEDKLRIIKHMMGEGSLQGSRMMEPINKLVNKIKTEVAQLSYQIHSQEKKMNETQSKDQRQRRKEAELHSDLTQLNVTIEILQSHIEATAINETYGILLTSFLNSSAAQRLANHSVYGAASPASQSQQTREETQRLLTNQLDRYRKNMAAYRTSLTQLKRRSQELNVSSINAKICGAPGDKSCDQALCGGANCKDDQGRRKCGGENCHGAVPVSGNALVSAHKVRLDLDNMATQLNDISEKIQEVQAVAQEAKVQSESTLSKAKDTKRRMEDSTERLRTFIRKIKDFLTEEGADPESIELVARQVLNISLPTNPGDLANLINQITQSIGNISRIETILNITSESVNSAKHTLQQAQEAREKADGMRGNITEIRSLLNRTSDTSKAAERAMSTANQSVRRLRSSLDKARKMMTDVEGAEFSLMNRLVKAAEEAETLRKKMESNRQTAERANHRARDAMLATEGLDQEMEEVRQSYGDLREKVIGLDLSSGSDLEKVRRIKDEAQDLLRKTTRAKDTLEKIQQKFQENEDEMISKTEEIRILENKTFRLLTDIRKQSNIYATC